MSKTAVTEKVKIKFFIVEDKNFYSEILNNISKIIKLDTTKNYIEYIRDIAHKKAKEQAGKLLSRLKWGMENERTLKNRYHIFETNYLQDGDKIGKLKNIKNIVRFALKQRSGKFFSLPIEQEDGWLIFQTADKKKSHLIDFYEAASQAWQDYISYGRSIYFNNEVENYYHNNIENQDIYNVNISYINFNKKDVIFDIEISPDSVQSYYEKNIEEFVTVRDTLPIEKVQEEILEILVEEKEKILFDSLIVSIFQKVKNNDFNFSIPNSQIKRNIEFTKNIPYYKSPFSLLADTIFTTQVDSIFKVQKNENILIGRVNKRKDIKKSKLLQLRQVIESLKTEKWDNSWDIRFQKFYHANKDKYFLDDKFRLSYIYFPNDTTNIEVTEEEAIQYFQNNLEKMTAPKKVKLETIFLPYSQDIHQTIYNIRSAISDLVSFSFLSKVYFHSHKMSKDQNIFLNYDQLDEKIQVVIDTLKIGDISEPIFTNEGCLIIKLIEKHESRVPDFYEMSPFDEQELHKTIISEIKMQRADSMNFNLITTIFDSINSVNDSLLKQYEISLHQTDYFVLKGDSVFVDSLLKIDKSDFDLLNDTKILRKIPKIFKVENGSAILFLDDKIVGKKITGSDSYSMAKDEFSRIVKYEECKTFTDYLAQLVENNEELILLSVFGGMKETGWLTYFDDINNIKNSSIILRDAFSHDIGTFSHPIRFNENGFGFYFIRDKKIVTLEDFVLIKVQYHEEYINRKFNDWFEKYKIEKKVKIFEEL